MNWFLDDSENAGSTPKKISLSINPFSYGVVELTSSMLNNDADSVRLLDSNQKEQDSFEYRAPQKGKTIGRPSLENDNFCLQDPSKGTTNNSCINPTIAPTIPAINTPTPTSVKSTTSIILPTYKPSITSNPPLTGSFYPENYLPSTAATRINKDKGEILGLSNQYDRPDDVLNHAAVASLSFLSSSYSLLSIVAIILKIKHI